MRRLVLPLFALAALTIPCAAGAWTWPVDGPVLRPFTFGADPYAGGQHRGIDVGAPVGSLVAAPAAGTVSFTGSVPGGGRAVTIRTPDGFSVTLLQLGAIGVLRGAAIGEGDAVGTVGESLDAVTHAPHVHLGVRYTASDNGYVDPLSLLPPRPVAVPAEPAAPPGAPEPASSEPLPAPPIAEAAPSADADVPAVAEEPAVTPAEPAAAEPTGNVAATPVEAPSDVVAPPANPPVEAVSAAAADAVPEASQAPALPPEPAVVVGASADEVVDAPLDSPTAGVEPAPPAATAPPNLSIALPSEAVLLPAPPPIEGSPPPLPPLLLPVPLPVLLPAAAPPAARPAAASTAAPAAPAQQRVSTEAEPHLPSRTLERAATRAPRDAAVRRNVTGEGVADRTVAVANTPRRRRPIPAALLVALAALGAVTAAFQAVRIIRRSDVLPDDTHLLRELDAPHRARVHDDRCRRPRPASAPARGGHVLPHGHGRARLEGVSRRGGAGARRQDVRRSNRRELERAS
jgi:hypothetical protein